MFNVFASQGTISLSTFCRPLLSSDLFEIVALNETFEHDQNISTGNFAMRRPKIVREGL